MMTAQRKWTVNAIKDAVRATGSHWFDPDSMRFFKSRVLPTVYQGPGGVFFVTSEKGPHGPRAYSVRRFDQATNDISTVGEFCEMTKSAAVRLAKKEAAGTILGFTRMVDEEDGGIPYALRGVTETTEDFRPISIVDQFAHDLQKHTNPERGTETATVEAARDLMNEANRHHTYMVQQCNGEGVYYRHDGDNPPHAVQLTREYITRLARKIGCKGVRFSGDPRGCTVKLLFHDGYTNDLGKEGYCVPTE